MGEVLIKRQLWLEEKLYDIEKPVVVCYTCDICKKTCCINILPDYRFGYYSRECLMNAKARMDKFAENHVERHIEKGEV